MRTFISITIPKSIVKILNKIQSQLPKQDYKLNIAKNHHLTLRFLGDVDEYQLKQVKEQLSTIEFNKFNLIIDKIGYFPNKDFIRVVWIGFKDNDKVNELQKLIDSKLLKIGFQTDKRFHAHITLARVKFVKDKVKFRNEINSIEIGGMKFEVNEFKLIKSTLTPEGPIYEDLESYTI